MSFALRLKNRFKRFLENCIEFSKLFLKRHHFIKATNDNLA
ncbi:hypothetical protein LEP1GSC188_0789 [Leptospira weilii serovar Topaz str. LT2116]|uniref:Uncharacterized protein n=1 Tax=Leptospira weilii serovar Topaz str. LT2116 TaxID=1088540 RepID=M3G777_9LEPT|nr:hypothetical protein LEP1GSC188_0789 [Leptospira weilii serovar Topaz str. LT2116]